MSNLCFGEKKKLPPPPPVAESEPESEGERLAEDDDGSHVSDSASENEGFTGITFQALEKDMKRALKKVDQVSTITERVVNIREESLLELIGSQRGLADELSVLRDVLLYIYKTAEIFRAWPGGASDKLPGKVERCLHVLEACYIDMSELTEEPSFFSLAWSALAGDDGVEEIERDTNDLSSARAALEYEWRQSFDHHWLPRQQEKVTKLQQMPRTGNPQDIQTRLDRIDRWQDAFELYQALPKTSGLVTRKGEDVTICIGMLQGKQGTCLGTSGFCCHIDIPEIDQAFWVLQQHIQDPKNGSDGGDGGDGGGVKSGRSGKHGKHHGKKNKKRRFRYPQAPLWAVKEEQVLEALDNVLEGGEGAEDKFWQLAQTRTVLACTLTNGTELLGSKGIYWTLPLIIKARSIIGEALSAIESARVVSMTDLSVVCCFEDPVDAVRIALVCLQTAGEYNRDVETKDEMIHLSFGIRTGEVVVWDHTIFGRPAITAMHLSTASADKDEIIIGTEVHDVLLQEAAKDPVWKGVDMKKDMLKTPRIAMTAVRVTSSAKSKVFRELFGHKISQSVIPVNTHGEEALALLEPDADFDGIEEKIRDAYQFEGVLLIAQVGNFSAIVKDRGVIPALAAVTELRNLALSQVEMFDGEMVCYEGHALYARFEDPAGACNCALALRAAVAKFNKKHSKAEDDVNPSFQIRMALDRGAFLWIKTGQEMFGRSRRMLWSMVEDLCQDNEIAIAEHLLKTISSMKDRDGNKMFTIQEKSFAFAGENEEAGILQERS